MQAKHASLYSDSALEKAKGSGMLLLCSTTRPIHSKNADLLPAVEYFLGMYKYY